MHFIFQPLGGKLFAASGTRVHYYESDENGCYQLLLDAPDIAATIFQPQIISQYISGPFAIAWDGRRLAIANVDGGRYATSNGDLLLGVFDSTGLHYLAGLKSGPMQPTTIGKGEKAVYWGEYLTPKEGVLKLAFDDTEGGADP